MKLNDNEYNFKKVFYAAESGSSLTGIDAKMLARKIIELECLIFKDSQKALVDVRHQLNSDSKDKEKTILAALGVITRAIGDE